MKRILLILAAVAIPHMALAQADGIDAPELYTPEQIKEKFGVEVTDGNYAPVVKSIFEWIILSASDDTYSADVVVESLKEMALRLPEPARGVVNYIVADFYKNYWRYNGWQMRNRTSAPDAGGTLDTWDMKRLFTEAIKYYGLALADPAALKATPTAQYDGILEFHPTRRFSENALPTLYDVLTSAAIKALTGELNVVMPGGRFVIDDPRWFAPAREFVAMEIPEPEEPSAEYEVLKMFRERLSFRLAEFEPEEDEWDVLRLMVAEVERFKYLRSRGVWEDADALYEAALRRLADDYANYRQSAMALTELAILYMEQGARWNRDNSDQQFRYKYVNAYNLCKQAIEKAGYNDHTASELMREITAPTLTITTESQPYPGEPFLALANHRNVENLYIRAYKLTDEGEVPQRYSGRQGWEWLGEREPVLEMPAVALPGYDDYQSHSSQFMIPGLKQGHYLILASDTPFTGDWRSGENLLITETSIQVTPLACITSDGDGGLFGQKNGSPTKQVYVTDSKTGKPIPGAQIEAYTTDIDQPRNADGVYPEKKVGTFHTDREGMAYITNRVSVESRRSGLSKIVITAPGGGMLVSYDDLYFSSGRYEEDDEPTEVFFTDRAIYRPGQTVYYKVLVFGPDGRGGNKTIEGHETYVTLYDVNGKEVAEQEVVTNEFGSAGGSFVLPQGLLNGYMRLEGDYGSVSFRVEEYKRPTFEVKFDPVKGSYRYGDKVEITGKAEALAGYSVDNSTVKYRVTRMFGYDPLNRLRIYMPQMTSPLEVAEGDVQTEADGKFTISFTASGEGVAYREAICNFVVTADITDANGETRSATGTVAVSDSPLLIRAYLSSEVNDRKKLKFPLATLNLNHNPVAAEVSVTVDELDGPGRILRDRLWGQSDTTLIARTEFERLFPHDIYADENAPSTYPIRERVAEFTVPTTATETAPDTLDLGALSRRQAGWYRVTLKATGKDGATAEDTHILLLNGTPSGKPTPIVNVDQWLTPIKTSAEPGEEAIFMVAAPEKGTSVRYDVYRNGRVAESRTLKAGPVPQKVSLPVGEKDRGGFAVRFLMVSGGRSYAETRRGDVPFTNKVLDVEFTTFRSQLLPGEHERWTLTVKNHEGAWEIAEMVATLYDASLDEFASLNWPSSYQLMPRTNNTAPYASFNDFTSQSNYRGYRLFRAGRPSSPSIVLPSGYYGSLMRNDGRGNTRGGGELNALTVIDPSFTIRGLTSFTDSDANKFTYDPTGTAVEEVVVSGIYERSKDSFTGSAAVLTHQDLKTVDNETGIETGMVFYDLELTEDQMEVTRQDLENVATRQNFNETAFFYPQLRTNEEGEFVVEFTIPESLTRWNMFGLAHTKDLKVGLVNNTLITQKQVAVSANAPRFLREGDIIEFTAKVNNITADALTGEALLRIYDAATMQPIDGILTSVASVPFSVGARQSSGLSWTLAIPEGVQAITYRLTAQAGAHTDGEERTIPVMTNTILVTETMPFMVRAGQTKEVDFTRLREHAATVKRNQGLTLEFTSNPAWYAVQAMPYLMDYPYECAEQMFSKFYANSLSAAIVDGSPRIKAIFEQWRDMPDSKNALLSNLEKNQELKQVLLEETPWVVQAENETERKKRVGLLFDLNRMAVQKRMAFDKLKKAQRGDGGFAWFDGLEPSRYITQHIIAGFSKLTALNAIGEDYAAEVQTIIDRGFEYLDADILRDYETAKRSRDFHPNKRYISYTQLHYLYAASFTGHKPTDSTRLEAFDFYLAQARRHWDGFSIYGKGLAALALHRYGDAEVALKVVASLRASSRTTEDMGMFWRENRAGYFWYEAPIETQALMISVFDEVADDAAAVDELKIWLLRNKQTNDWQTTKATADACYALLRTGGNLLDESRLLEVKIGGQPLAEAADEEIRPEAGTGYVKTSWAGSDVTPEMGLVEVTNPNRAGIAWGGLYWQYFEQSDKITGTETDLRMEKQIFIKRNTPRGPELTEIKDGTPVEVGDLLTVRLILRAHRDYEYVHLKDMRASGLEPVRTVSGYRYQDGLYYYENVKDASTNFFITSLRGGTYVFEYDLRVTHAGDFSNGITTFQCMYAPEFSAHSEGVRIRVE